MDSVEQDLLLKENRELKERIQSLEAQLESSSNASVLSAGPSLCSADDTPVLRKFTHVFKP